MSVYPVGTVVRLRTEIRDVDGVLVNPASLALTLLLPDGTITVPVSAPAIATDGLGLFRYDYPLAQPGRHIARWVATTPTVADEEVLDGLAQWGSVGIISRADAKKQLKVAATDVSSDDQIDVFIQAATEICERHAGSVLPVEYTERHHRGGRRSILLDHRPVVKVASVTTAGGYLLNVDDYQVDAEAGVITRMIGDYDSYFPPGRVTVVYTAGRTVIRAADGLAGRIIVQHLWETQRGRMGARAAGADEVWDPRWGYAIPRRALELLGDSPMGIA